MSGRIEEMSGRVELKWSQLGDAHQRPVARSRSAGEEITMGLLGVHNDLVVEEKQLVVVEEEVGKQAEERDMTAVLAAFPEYKSILLETQVVVSSRHLYIKKYQLKVFACKVALMSGPGALPLTHRHYIALLACSALKCPTIAKTQVAIWPLSDLLF